MPPVEPYSAARAVAIEHVLAVVGGGLTPRMLLRSIGIDPHPWANPTWNDVIDPLARHWLALRAEIRAATPAKGRKAA